MANTILGEKRGTSATVTKSDQGLDYSYTSTFIVVADSKFASRESVLMETPGLPIVGLKFGSNQMLCTSKTATRMEGHANYWEVECKFESKHPDQKQDEENKSDDPTTWIPVFKVDSFATKESIIFKDNTGAILANSAGTPFDTPLTTQKLLPVMTVTQYENPTLDINTFLDRNDCVNKTTFAGRDARTLLINLDGAELGYYMGYPCWKVTYKITYDRDTHDVVLLDVGPVDKNGVRCMDKHGGFGIIGMLNSSGPNVGLQKTAGPPDTKTYKVKKEIEFADFLRR